MSNGMHFTTHQVLSSCSTKHESNDSDRCQKSDVEFAQYPGPKRIPIAFLAFFLLLLRFPFTVQGPNPGSDKAYHDAVPFHLSPVESSLAVVLRRSAPRC